MIRINFVPRFYRMDPKTEDVVPNGNQLANGMVVLIEDPNQRVPVKSTDMEDWEYDRALTRNRWCEVTNLEIINKKYHGAQATFIGVYEDGLKIKRTADIRESWIVKIDSLSDSMVKATARYQNLHSMVSGLLSSNPPASEFFDDQVEETTRQILKLFGGV